MATAKDTKRTKGGVVYRGERFPGFNKPKRAPSSSKKKMRVLAKKGDQIKDQIVSQDQQFKEKETVQETFNLSESISETKKVGAFKLPSLDFLKIPEKKVKNAKEEKKVDACLLYTSPSPRD